MPASFAGWPVENSGLNFAANQCASLNHRALFPDFLPADENMTAALTEASYNCVKPSAQYRMNMEPVLLPNGRPTAPDHGLRGLFAAPAHSSRRRKNPEMKKSVWHGQTGFLPDHHS